MRVVICDVCEKRMNMKIAKRGRGRGQRFVEKTEGMVIHAHDFSYSGSYDYYECDRDSIHVCNACLKKIKAGNQFRAGLLKVLKDRI